MHHVDLLMHTLFVAPMRFILPKMGIMDAAVHVVQGFEIDHVEVVVAA